MPKNDETAGLDFLDFLFTIAMSAGLTPELLQIGGMTGLLSEDWQKSGRYPNGDEWFNIWVFGLGFLNLTLSWFGYHASIKSRPLNYYSGYGMARFILDVSLVIMYGVILLKYKSFGVVLFILMLVYVIFVIWDWLKIGEYQKPPKGVTEPEASKYFSVKLCKAREKYLGWSDRKIKFQAYRREWVTHVCSVLFILLWVIYFWCHVNRWIALIGAIFITVFYRFNKNHTTWERLLKVKDA